MNLKDMYLWGSFFYRLLRTLKQILDWYINASLHVAFATTALVGITNYYAHLNTNWNILFFVFCATMSSYNIIKYLGYVLTNQSYKNTLKAIIGVTGICLVTCLYFFFTFKPVTQLAIVFFSFLNILYVLPLGKGLSNLRNAAGIKIYIVSICWAGITLLLPLLEAGLDITTDVILKFFQRFILTLILILIFEINDMKYDDVRLKTVPQSIGIKNTKTVIYVLSSVFYLLDFFKNGHYEYQVLVNFILVVVILLFTYFAHPDRSKYYTLFWAESVPVLWYFLILSFTLFFKF